MKPVHAFMEEAIHVAVASARAGDYAVGAVDVQNQRIIARGQTRLKRENDPTAHAEIVAIRNACRKLRTRYLDGCVLYSTHEPCPMCASAAVWAKMEGIVFGAFVKDAEKKASQRFSWRQMDISCRDVLSKGNPKLKCVGGFERKKCLELFDLSR